MKRSILAGLLLAFALVVPTNATRAPQQGTIVLDTLAPAYGQPVAAHWTFAKRASLPALALLCYQGHMALGAELGVPRDVTGSGAILLANESSSVVPGTLDYSQPASCQIYVLDDLRGRNGNGTILTNVIGFTVPQETP